jgi:Trk K+ transport system NAD-binding subunit
MVSRLVLGCGVVGQELLERLDSGSVRVLSADPERVDRKSTRLNSSHVF